MAKRKRLIPTQHPADTKAAGPTGMDAPAAPRAGLSAPVAQVVGDISATAALQEMTDHIADARARGLMLVALPLGQIEVDHLSRDRIMPDDITADADMTALIDSLRARGQQTPVEVVRLEGGAADRYGLISGMRRVTALRHLHAQIGDARFASVMARVVPRQDMPGTYVAMVEENEIRADISFWERARIVLHAVEAGAYPDKKEALRGLFGNVSRSKRSKIGSFMDVVAALDGVLRFPKALSEKRGLALARVLAEGEGAENLRAALADAAPDTAEAEQAALDRALSPARPAPKPSVPHMAAAVQVTRDGDRLILSGQGVDEALQKALEAWLAARP